MRPLSDAGEPDAQSLLRRNDGIANNRKMPEPKVVMGSKIDEGSSDLFQNVNMKTETGHPNSARYTDKTVTARLGPPLTDRSCRTVSGVFASRSFLAFPRLPKGGRADTRPR